MVERQAESFPVNTNFIVLGLIRPEIEPESTVSVADALSSRLLMFIGLNLHRYTSQVLLDLEDILASLCS